MFVHDTSTQVSQKSLQSSRRATAQALCDVNETQRTSHGSYKDTSHDTRWQPASTAEDLQILATLMFHDDALARECMLPPPMPQSVVLRPSEVAALQQLHPLIRGRLVELGHLRETTRQQVMDLQCAYRVLRREDPHNARAIADAGRALQAGKDAFITTLDEEASLSDVAEVLVDCAFMQKARAESNNAAPSYKLEAGKDLEQILEEMRAKILAGTPIETAT